MLRVVYPKGQATGAGNDMRTLNAAINGGAFTGNMSDNGVPVVSPATPLNENDVLIMKATNFAGVATDWFMREVRQEGDTCPVIFPTETRNMMYFQTFFDDPGYMISITKRITIRGETNEDGSPKTVIRGATDLAEFQADVTGLAGHAGLDTSQAWLFSGNTNFGIPNRVENLYFKWHKLPIGAIAPIVLENCVWDSVITGMVLDIDNRYTYGSDLIETSPDFENLTPIKSFVKDCVLNNLILFVECPGAEVNLINNTFKSESPFPWPISIPASVYTIVLRLFAYIVRSDTGFSWGQYWNEETEEFENNPPDLMLKHQRNFYMDGNTVDMTDNPIPHASDTLQIFAISGGDASVKTVNPTIVNNNFVGCSNGNDATIDFGGDYWGVTQIESGVASDNLFTACRCGVVDWFGYSYNLRVLNNKFVSDNQISPTFGYLPAVTLATAQNAFANKNDYTESGRPTISVGGVLRSDMLLQYAANCTIHDVGGYQPGSAKAYVTDIAGYNNRIIGQTASNAEKPAGIGQLMKSLAEAKRAERKATFRFN